MSGGGGKGGSETSGTTIPDWIKQPSQRAIARGEDIAQIGYTPYMGPDVAALTAPQMEGMQNTASAASAFGMGGGDPMAGMPQAQTYGGGVQGYSSFPIYNQIEQDFAAARPGQYDYMQSFFVDPISGAPAAPLQSQEPEKPAATGWGLYPTQEDLQRMK